MFFFYQFNQQQKIQFFFLPYTDFFNEYDQNIENEKSDDLFETTINSKTTTNDPNIENNDPKTIENFPNDETLSSSPLIIESSEVEIVEETIVDDHQSAETIFTLTNDNDDEDKTKKNLTTTIVESIVDEGKNKMIYTYPFFNVYIFFLNFIDKIGYRHGQIRQCW